MYHFQQGIDIQTEIQHGDVELELHIRPNDLEKYL